MTNTSEIRGMTLYQCFNSVPPNFSAAQRLLEQGAHINASEDSDGTPLLAQIIMDCFYDSESKYLPAAVRFFLENGYDVHKENGKYGGEALYALCYSTYDKHILDAAKLLLDAGADPLYVTDTVPEDVTVLDVVSEKASAGIPVYDSLEQECLFWVLYDIMKAKTKSLSYSGIRWADAVIGKRIEKVCSCASTAEAALFDYATGSHDYRNCFTDDMVLVCEGIPLRLTHYCHAYVKPFGIADKTIDLSEHFPSLIGRQIKVVQFLTNTVELECRRLHGSSLEISLDDGRTLAIRDNGDRLGEEYCARMELL